MRARLSCVMLVVLLLVPATLAQAPAPERVWTVLTSVRAVVQDNYAVVHVIADIGNRGPDPEFPFRVRIPDDAFVTGLTIERDGKVHEAQIKERATARAEYEEWKAQAQTGGLIEKERRSSVYAFLINVADFTSVRATLTYERYLVANQGVYDLALEAPVSGFGEDLGARFDVVLRHAEGVATAWGAPTPTLLREGDAYHVSHAVGPRVGDAPTPFEASYTLRPTDEGGALLTTVRDGQGWFVHRFRAPSDPRELPLDLVLVLDVSGSMSGLKVTQMKDAAVQVLQSLGPDDRLHLAFFSGAASSPWSGLRAMTPEARSGAAAEIQNALIAGGTNIESGLVAGFDALDGVTWREDEGRLPVLVLLTDGQPTVGETSRETLRKLARDANAHDAHVFAIAFGSDAEWGLVRGLADDGNGTALRVPEGDGAEVDIRRFMDALTTPVLKDVRIEYPEGVTAYRATAPLLFAGSEMLVVGTFDPAKGLDGATVRATSVDGPRTYEVAAQAGDGLGFLPRLVSYHRILDLQALIDAEGASAGWVSEITSVAVKHGFVTDYTSLVLTLEPATPAPGAPEGGVVLVRGGSDEAGTTERDITMAYDVYGARAPGASNAHDARFSSTPPTTSTVATGPTPTPTTAQVPAAGALMALAMLALVAFSMRRR